MPPRLSNTSGTSTNHTVHHPCPCVRTVRACIRAYVRVRRGFRGFHNRRGARGRAVAGRTRPAGIDACETRTVTTRRREKQAKRRSTTGSRTVARRVAKYACESAALGHARAGSAAATAARRRTVATRRAGRANRPRARYILIAVIMKRLFEGGDAAR